jgi:hypothetical protein
MAIYNKGSKAILVEFGNTNVDAVYYQNVKVFPEIVVSCDFSCSTLADATVSQTCYSGCTSLANKFKNCDYLTKAEIDCDSCSDISNGFWGCSELKNVKLNNTNNITSMHNIFENSTKLTGVTISSMENVTNASFMFSICLVIKDITLPYKSKITNTSYMFVGCESLTSCTVPSTSSVTDMTYMFSNCISLTEINVPETNEVTTIFGFASGCKNLKKITLGDVGNVQSMSDNFLDSANTNVEYIYMKNFGKSLISKYTIYFSYSPWGANGDDNRTSLVDTMITYSYDRAANSLSSITLKFSTTTKAILTDDEKAQITAKGYTIS